MLLRVSSRFNQLEARFYLKLLLVHCDIVILAFAGVIEFLVSSLYKNCHQSCLMLYTTRSK